MEAYTFFVPTEGVSTGGAERQLSLLGRELAADLDVHFVVGDYGQAETSRADGVTLHRAYRPAASATPVRRLGHLRSLFHAMRRADADVYVVRGDELLATACYTFARLLGRRWVYNLAVDSQAERSPGPVGRLTDRVFGAMLRDADHVIAQSSHQQRRLRASFAVDATVVPNGYPVLDGGTESSPREAFLFVGRLDPGQKRPHLFLDLAERVPAASFVLVGPDSADERYSRAVASRARRLDNVEFLGRLPPEEVYDQYDRALALVNTSTQEGFPNTFLEAWRAATPVVSLTVDPGRFLDGAAVGCADGSFEELVALTEHVVADPERWTAIGRDHRAAFEARYGIAECATRYANALTHALD
nr:glycosyltransferase family 4 protein [Halomarina oriensis]